jgi:outer membrane protein assembly factor BamB
VRWRDRNTTYNLANGTPVVYGGLVFLVSGSRLLCYDAVPKRDLDGDGRADDGKLDLEQGENFDLVWEVNLGGQASPPVVVETPRGVQVVVVVGTDVRGYWALPRDAQGRIPPVGQQVWSVSSSAPASSTPTTADGQIPAPIVIDNTLLLVPSYHQAGAQNSAGFYAVLLSDPPQIVRSQGVFPAEWYQPRTGNAGNWLLPPVAGYVPNYGQGGGNDIVVYFGARRDLGGTKC